ncbi:hypothetical protein [Citrobacter amalonaticus]|nr:hypothetical protein [Citrobacter amalonaticus]
MSGRSYQQGKETERVTFRTEFMAGVPLLMAPEQFTTPVLAGVQKASFGF